MKTLHTMRAAAAVAAIAFLSVPAAVAHIGYTGRNFGTFSGGEAPVSILNQTVSGAFGWADGTDEDFGDSHRLRAYRFNLAYDATITVEVAATSNGGALLGDLLPGLSIYGGLAHTPPSSLDHDTAAVSMLWLSTLPGVAKEGVFRALGDWRVGNDDGLTLADLSSFSFMGYAVDGTAANFGAAPGLVGDGTADGFLRGTFHLPAGDYSLFVGGADYAAQIPGETTNRGVDVTLTVVPEPASAALAFLAAALTLTRRSPRTRFSHRPNVRAVEPHRRCAGD
jgi:hypothetical protein